MRNRHVRWLGSVVVASMMAASAPARAGDTENERDYEKLIADKAPAIVTLKFVLKLKMGQYGDNETEREATAVMIDPKGVVLCSSTELGGLGGVMGRMMSSRFGGMSATPSDIKVILGDDAQGLDAELMARDSELDLAWVRIKDPGDRSFAFIDFSKSARPRLGQRLLTVERMGKYYGRTPRVGEMRVSAITHKPRELYMPGGEQVMLGLPVFTAAGEVVGVGVMQSPSADSPGGDDEFSLSSLAEMEETTTGLILPAAEVAKATARARESGDGGGKSTTHGKDGQ